VAAPRSGHVGPGSTHTPITYLHATLAPGARLTLPWPTEFNALVHALAGNGHAGPDDRPLAEGELAFFGPGSALAVRAAGTQPQAVTGGWEVLVLGGLPIREPIARYGLFVMNTNEEIIEERAARHCCTRWMAGVSASPRNSIQADLAHG
jgi:quercetin 2,3-dioxygenase